jgi:hypothetical protein
MAAPIQILVGGTLDRCCLVYPAVRRYKAGFEFKDCEGTNRSVRSLSVKWGMVTYQAEKWLTEREDIFERQCTRCDNKYGECLNKYSKRHVAINPPQNTPLCFEHTYPFVLATFWISSGSPLSLVTLVALSWLPRRPESIQNVYLSWSFDFGGEPEVPWCHIRWISWMGSHRNIFIWEKFALPEVMCDTKRCHDGGWNRLTISQVVLYARHFLNALMSPYNIQSPP